MILSPYLRGSHDEPAHWCPGCKMMHVLPWKRGGWTYNGDPHKPTFMPSFVHRWTDADGDKVCHYMLAGGMLIFLSDCSHDLRGTKTPLPPIPADIAGA